MIILWANLALVILAKRVFMSKPKSGGIYVEGRNVWVKLRNALSLVKSFDDLAGSRLTTDKTKVLCKTFFRRIVGKLRGATTYCGETAHKLGFHPGWVVSAEW